MEVDDVEVIHGDTALTPMGWGTYGSRTTAVSGAAVTLATRKIKEKSKALAAHLLEAATEDIEYEDGRFFVRGAPDQHKTIQDIALMANVAWDMPEGMEPGLEASAFYDPPNFTYPFGAHLAVVEVDPTTGQIDLKRYVAVDDCGVQINPMIVEGQVHGGVVQGVGPVLWEGAVYDENGQLLTGSMQDYALPRADVLPDIEVRSNSTPSPHHPLGVKGVGRGRDHRVHAHGLQRRDGRAAPVRDHSHRHAADAGEGLAGYPRRAERRLGMYPAQTTYHRAGSVAEAVQLLADNEGAKVLAGGHSLIPMMKLRLATPAVLVDIGHIGALKGIEAGDGGLSIGALTTFAEIAASDLVKQHAPLLAEAAALVGDPTVRNRATIGGNVSHGDPQSDSPTVLTALGATLNVTGPGGDRSIAVADFPTGLLENALSEDEVLTSVSVPSLPAGSGSAYCKFPHPGIALLRRGRRGHRDRGGRTLHGCLRGRGRRRDDADAGVVRGGGPGGLGPGRRGARRRRWRRCRATSRAIR